MGAIMKRRSVAGPTPLRRAAQSACCCGGPGCRDRGGCNCAGVGPGRPILQSSPTFRERHRASNAGLPPAHAGQPMSTGQWLAKRPFLGTSALPLSAPTPFPLIPRPTSFVPRMGLPLPSSSIPLLPPPNAVRTTRFAHGMASVASSIAGQMGELEGQRQSAAFFSRLHPHDVHPLINPCLYGAESYLWRFNAGSRECLRQAQDSADALAPVPDTVTFPDDDIWARDLEWTMRFTDYLNDAENSDCWDIWRDNPVNARGELYWLNQLWQATAANTAVTIVYPPGTLPGCPDGCSRVHTIPNFGDRPVPSSVWLTRCRDGWLYPIAERFRRDVRTVDQPVFRATV